ncbi:MAG: ribosomal protein S18-alanine N-acetyltransferase [Gammaproteobacteria bacterium]|nr:ribosomal protein S18-alanine N-acetyltransferase [Gammaproteobacteria bacterium]MCW8910693.1 ribosomal protein S18-alanine N-acetyltransferase [Gammaproteobacteria bacterium]MCW9005299.1 ribosomal protein S18-alanine N-acetyltransferase [Gammaproteobacteria bacterium]MCW9056435.1 ribosomal protein S18-alanine N-acetyltransferase [Gammaproteobacteria bacterium]
MALNPDIEPVTGFRPMYFDDVARIVEIEESAYLSPWTVGIFRDCIRVGYNCFVYLQDEVIQAYGIITVAANEAHILNLCVSNECRGQGLGRKVLHKLIDVAEQMDTDSIFLEVRESNEIAIQLYKDEGFNEIGVRKNYYPAKEGKENALIFAKALNIPEDENQN